MLEYQTIKIENKEYYIIDSIQNLRAEDSFIHRKNKLKSFTGSGEARKYVGSYTGESGKKLSAFFGFSAWGKGKKNEKRVYSPISQTCFFSKSNLLRYLEDAEIEYKNQEQVYHNDISGNFIDSFTKITSLDSELLSFEIVDVSDFEDSAKTKRAYIRSEDDIWSIWRALILPKISYLSILKLVPVKDVNSTPLFYFRIFLDYQFRSIVHPQLFISSNAIEPDEKPKATKAPKRAANRIGGDLFRKKVIEHMPQCPFTKISDDKLLIASHIKPYMVCIKEGREDQALDYLNGLALTPTYDKLFDQGYITFKDSGELVCGTLLSKYTWEKLNINPKAKNIMRIYPEKRQEYLEYHRRHIFQDDFDMLT
jgi:putative restriction endonuclease